MHEKIIRGRRVVYERNAPVPAEHLRYTLDVFEERDNLVEVLGVEPQDVVLGQAESADWGFITDAGMWPMPVVAV